MDESRDKGCKNQQIVSNKVASPAQQKRVIVEVDEEEEVALLKERLARARYDQAVASSAADEAEVKANLLRQELEDAHVAVMGYHEDCTRLQQRNALLRELVEKLTWEMAQKDSQAESSKGARRSDGAGVKARPKETARDATASKLQQRRTPSSNARQRPSTARTGAAIASLRGTAAPSRGREDRTHRGSAKDLQPSRGASPLTSGRSSAPSARARGRTAPSRQAADADTSKQMGSEFAEQERGDLLRRRNNLDFEIRQLESLAMQVQELEPLLLEAWREAQEAKSSGTNSGHSVSTLGLEVEAMVETIERSLHLVPSPPLYLSFRDLHKDLIEDPGNRPTGSRLSRLLASPKSKPT
mmetsp:Transcript_21949/g.50122  ORF Transcript_21949/g.50122 Transcript_21949/m.50122 type:complete len:357 (+) Transcript_21949:159-1229(+)